MLLQTEQFKAAINRLDERLFKKKIDPIELRICGGAALCLWGLSTRMTRDIDVIHPIMDDEVLEIARIVAKELSIPEGWINNGPKSLDRDLEGKVISIFVLGRTDFIATKLFALCDRDESDLSDLIALNPSKAEIINLTPWLLERDASDLWVDRVKSQLEILYRKLGYESE